MLQIPLKETLKILKFSNKYGVYYFFYQNVPKIKLITVNEDLLENIAEEIIFRYLIFCSK